MDLFSLYAIVLVGLGTKCGAGEMRPSSSPLHSRPCGLIWGKGLGSILGTQHLSPVRGEAKTTISSPLFPHKHLLCFSEEEKHKQNN